MMNDTLTKLLEQLSKNPNDDELLGQLGIYYTHNPNGDKELYYFKQAYHSNPSIKNTINYAYCLSYEYGEIEKALNIIKNISSLQINHFYYYALYAQLLFTLEKPNNIEHYQTIINCCHQALKLFNQLSQEEQSKQCDKKVFIKNNLAITLAKIGQFDGIYQLFDDIYQDISNEAYIGNDWQFDILLNHVYIAIAQNDITTAHQYLTHIEQLGIYDNIDIAQAYATINDHQKCMALIKDEIDNIHISWDMIWYEIFKENPDIWKNKIQQELYGDMIWLKEETTSLKLSQDEKEKQTLMDNIQFHQQNIAYFKRLLKQGKPDLPNRKPTNNLRYLYGCYIIGCQIHDN